jgi:hypothetical protein
VLKRRSATPERRLEYQQEHRALVHALKQRDAERARALCMAHLLHVRTNMLGPERPADRPGKSVVDRGEGGRYSPGHLDQATNQDQMARVDRSSGPQERP